MAESQRAAKIPWQEKWGNYPLIAILVMRKVIELDDILPYVCLISVAMTTRYRHDIYCWPSGLFIRHFSIHVL
jgi:hypothetical protein